MATVTAPAEPRPTALTLLASILLTVIIVSAIVTSFSAWAVQLKQEAHDLACQIAITESAPDAGRCQQSPSWGNR